MSESRRSAACANELHPQCPHLMNLRLPGGLLCRCGCHVPCPVSGEDTASLDAWWDACICPGSGWQRDKGRQRWHSDRPPAMFELEHQLRARKSALARARAALAGKVEGVSAAGVRRMLVEELRAQGAELPADSVLDWEVKKIQSAPPPNAGLLRTARSLLLAHREARSGGNQLRSAVREARTLRGPHNEEPYVTMDTDYSLPAATVAADQQALAQLGDPDGEVYVSLLPQDGTDEGQVAVFIDSCQVAILTAADAARYQPSMAAARKNGAVLLVPGVIESTPDEQKQLRVYPAGIL